MFFIGIFGIGSKAKPLDKLESMECPACRNKTEMSVTHSYNYPHVFFIPLWKFGSQYIVTCPACASVFEMSPQRGKELELAGRLAIQPQELRILRNNAGRRCPYCRGRVDNDHHFCPHCGKSLG